MSDQNQFAHARTAGNHCIPVPLEIASGPKSIPTNFLQRAHLQPGYSLSVISLK